MKKRWVILIVIAIIISVVIGAGYLIRKKADYQLAEVANSENQDKNENIIAIPEKIEESQIIMNEVSDASYIIDISDNDVIASKAQYIIIGTVTSIDGVTNYNPETKHYVMTRTVGNVKVQKVLKGDLNKETIPFIRLGGIIPLSEYEKTLPEAHKEKTGLTKMSQEEKEKQYVLEMMGGDIEIEKNKTYLMYMTYREDYGRYAINFMQYGLREIETTGNNINTQSNNSIMVRNNTNGQFETLDSILPNEQVTE